MDRNLFKSLLNIYRNQQWLVHKEDELIELLEASHQFNGKKLILDLLENFRYIESSEYAELLNQIAYFIVNESDSTIENTLIVASAYDEEADSSQAVLQAMKIPLNRNGWGEIKLINHLGKSIKFSNRGFTNIILIDEFIGSGQTHKGRIEYLQKNICGEFKLQCCFVAGMSHAIKRIQDMGISVFCPLILHRGISDRYIEDNLTNNIEIMLKLESSLAKEIGERNLNEYSFGFNKAESLYTTEGCHGNTPNSVFPIFWWPRNNNNYTRKKLLTRFEKGFDL